ncbi:MAG: hypothetical protein AAF320_02815 [Myxococcota bacterium]
MIVVLLLAIIAYVCDLVASAVACGLGQVAMGVSVMPAFISYVVYYHRPAHAVAVAFLFGIASDVLSGTHLGLHLIVSLSLWFGCAFSASFLPRARGNLLWAHMAVTSLLWHLLAAVLLAMQGYTAVNALSVVGVLMTALCEASMGLWLVRRVHQLLEYTGQRRALSDMLFLGQP